MDVWLQTWNQTVAAIVTLSGSVGFAVLGYFEMNPNLLFNRSMHYIGVGLCVICCFGLGFETMFSVYFWMYAILPMIGNVSFAYFVFQAKKTLPSKDIKYVNKLSKKCIITESIILLSTVTSIDTY